MIDAKCPKCQSEQTQSIQIAMQMGTQRGTAETNMKGIGIGLSGGIGVGLGQASTSSFSQTDFVRKYQMPPFPSRGLGLPVVSLFLIFFTIIAFAVDNYIWMGFLVPLSAFFIWLFINQGPAIKKKQTEWSERKNYLHHAWICHRCGTDWIPN